MYPELLTIGPLTIHTYGVFYALGILAAITLAEYLHQKNGGKPGTFQDMGFLVVIGILVGARALFILVNLGYFLRNPLDVFKIWNGGLVFYGGLIGGALAFILAARLKHLDLWPLADTVAPALTFGHAIGRIGCFFAGSCYGKPTDMPWAVTFTDPKSLATGVLGVPVHPTQLYESALLILLTVVLLKIRSHVRFPGQVITSYGIMYGIIRFGLEFFRGDPRGSVEILGTTLSTSQAISLLIVPLSLAGYVYLSRRKGLGSRVRGLVSGV
ncbi:MAG: prolipoprotein diacylglyceryl transferase [Deltaproteobacteria bacterium]|nr:prolipoprotein diacylglyceryl transferase [Deltaproteobacteria bacterium]